MTVMRRIRAIPSWQVTLGVALLALGFLIAAQLASEGPRVRYTTQERTAARRDRARAAGPAGRAQGPDPRPAGQDPGASRPRARVRPTVVRQLNDDLQQARIAGGPHRADRDRASSSSSRTRRTPVPPDGSESDYLVGSRDIRTVVEELWLAGAEAIAVNGERITPTTAIIDIGTSVLVNSAYLAPPYQVTAIGPPDLYDRLSESPGVRRLRPGARRGLRHPGLVRRAGLGRRAGLRRDGDPALFAAARVAVDGASGRARARSPGG